MMSSPKKQAAWTALFFVYLAALMTFVVLKFHGSVADLMDRIRTYHIWETDYGFRPLNLTPFRTIRMQLRDHGWLSLLNLVANVAAFVPFGALLPCVSRRMNHTLRVFIAAVAFSCAIEVFQLATYTGSCDVDDVLLNTLGAMLGYAVYRRLASEADA